MYILLTILIVIAALLLILLVLVQNSKGGGLAAGFNSGNQVMGVRKTTDFLEKSTWGLTGFIVVLAIVAVGIHSNSTGTQTKESQVKGEFEQVQEAESAVAPNLEENVAYPIEQPAEQAE